MLHDVLPCVLYAVLHAVLYAVLHAVTEAKDVKLRKKQVELQLRHEDELSAALAVWRNEILPNWETT